MNRLLIAACLALPLSISPSANAMDGQSLLAHCSLALEIGKSPATVSTTPSAALDAGYCIGLVKGMLGTSSVWARPLFMEDAMPILDSVEKLVAYLQKNPDLADMDDTLLVMLAMVEAYGCARGQ